MRSHRKPPTTPQTELTVPGDRRSLGERLLWLVSFTCIALNCPGLRSDDSPAKVVGRINFAAQIAPILEQNCLRCHSPGNEQGDLSLHTIHDIESQGHVVAGDAAGSHLLDLVVGKGGAKPAMPKSGDPLSVEQVGRLRQWIQEGAVWPAEFVLRTPSKADLSWWSLQPLAQIEPPPVANPDSQSKTVSDIDRFVWAKLAERGLRPNPPADRRTLIRRATYDLTGLPPSPEEVAAFVEDDSPDAYPQLIDRLLASPRYGERWGRHWLDVTRFGESRGYERNEIITDLWPFRDYVIRSLNADKPFDQFIREHLAGDVLAPEQPEVEVGAAFLVAGPYDDVGNQDPVQAAQIRADTLDEIIRTTGDAFLGLTVGCARCHDHKFDPIRQADYYRWYATFAGIRHGSREVATRAAREERAARLQPLEARRQELAVARDQQAATLEQRAEQAAAALEPKWTRPPVDRQGTEEQFTPVTARYVRLTSEGQDANPDNTNSFNLDEMEIWSADPVPRNVALAANGGVASGPARTASDAAEAYAPANAIDGKIGARFIATGGHLTIELAAPTRIDRVLFYSARGQANPEHGLFVFPCEYRLEVSDDGQSWSEVANSHDRKPANPAHRRKRLLAAVTTADDSAQLAEWNRQLAEVQQEIAAIPPLPSWWVGTRNAEDAKGPFHIFLGGSPQRRGDAVSVCSPSFVSIPATENGASQLTQPFGYQLGSEAPETERRRALADWIVHPQNPLTPRVLANRVWHYHFGTGIVDTPSDFGYMGGRPTHPELLDWLAQRLLDHGWRLKPLHRDILLSQTYQQASTFRPDAAAADGDARLLWRYPPRRLSAEEIRDTVLTATGKLNLEMGGPGFKLYRYLQDNVATYVPLDQHGPETYRRAVYHHNARAARVDLMTDFDQPDCAFSTPTRAETTTPLQALTMLNHTFTLDMATALAQRIEREAGSDPAAAIQRAYELCYQRSPTPDEAAACRRSIEASSLTALCRVLLNTSELVYVD